MKILGGFMIELRVARMAFLKRTLLIGLSVGTFAPAMASLAWATSQNDEPALESPVPFFLKGTDSFNRLREAVDGVEAESTIKGMLQDNQTHALSVSQRITGEDIETT